MVSLNKTYISPFVSLFFWLALSLSLVGARTQGSSLNLWVWQPCSQTLFVSFWALDMLWVTWVSPLQEEKKKKRKRNYNFSNCQRCRGLRLHYFRGECVCKSFVCKAALIQVTVSTPESSLFDDKKKRDTTQEWNLSSKNRQEYLQVTLSKQKSDRQSLEKSVYRNSRLWSLEPH